MFEVCLRVTVNPRTCRVRIKAFVGLESTAMSFCFKKIIAVIAAVVGFGTTQIVAATLAPGDTIALPGSTLASNPELAGTIINDNVLTSNAVGLPANSNFVVRLRAQNRVVRSNTDGTLIFAPRIREDIMISQGPFLIDRVVLTGFGAYDIDASFRVDDEGDRGPTSASRSANGDVLSFGFGFPLPITSSLFGAPPSEESYFFSLKTDATAFQNTGRISIFGRAAGDDFNTYRLDVAGLAVPTEHVPAVPVPATAVLIISGLCLIAGLRRGSVSA